MADETKSTGRFGKGNPGKPKGALNKTTREFKETVAKLLSDNADNVALWLEQVAVGIPEVTDADGKVATKGVPGDPGKALDLMSKLAEYAAPKLARTEHLGDGGGPVKFEITAPWLKSSIQDRN